MTRRRRVRREHHGSEETRREQAQEAPEGRDQAQGKSQAQDAAQEGRDRPEDKRRSQGQGEARVREGRADEEQEEAAYLGDCLQADDGAGSRYVEESEVSEVENGLAQISSNHLLSGDSYVTSPVLSNRRGRILE